LVSLVIWRLRSVIISLLDTVLKTNANSEKSMRIYVDAEVERHLDNNTLIEALRTGFRANPDLPQRSHYTLPPVAGRAAGTLLVMPAWDGHVTGVKIVSVFPDNGRENLPSVMGSYLLIDGSNGRPLATLDGAALTARRTAGISALAADYLSRPDAKIHLVMGGGRLAGPLVRAMRSVRRIESSLIWARRYDQAESIAAQLRADGIAAEPVRDKAKAIEAADIISCATLATDPILPGACVKQGAHVDLVGAFRPDMREADDELICKADIFVDTRTGALEEAGELRLPIEAGILTANAVLGELADLCSDRIPGRRSDQAVTVFKSVGTALADLIAAKCVWDASTDQFENSGR
jgi:alanine dehydrogenase